MASMSSLQALLALGALLAGMLQGAQGHGLMTTPRSRNWLHHIRVRGYVYADGMNGGGKLAVSNNFRYKWPAGNHLLCGEASSVKNPIYQKRGPAQATYKPGQVIPVEWVYKIGHAGYIQLRLCPASATRDSQCTKLQRADGKGTSWYIPEQKNWGGGGAQGADTYPARKDLRYGGYTVRKFPEYFCGKGYWCGSYTGNTAFTIKYVIPRNARRGPAILQWYWVTGHNCWPCSKEDPLAKNGKCRAPPGKGASQICGAPGSIYPEEFWNCADVLIK